MYHIIERFRSNWTVHTVKSALSMRNFKRILLQNIIIFMFYFSKYQSKFGHVFKLFSQLITSNAQTFIFMFSSLSCTQMKN